MGDAKANVDCALKPTLALKPEARGKWLTKAIAAVKDGRARVSDVYDIVNHPKFINGVTPIIGKKMRRALTEGIDIFTDKQKKNLEACQLIKQYPLEEPQATGAKKVDEEKMDEMMARCRAFVRDNETLWEGRKQEIDSEIARREEEARLEAERLRRLEDEKARAERERARAEEEGALKEQEALLERQKGVEANATAVAERLSKEQEALARLEEDLKKAAAEAPAKEEDQGARESSRKTKDRSSKRRRKSGSEDKDKPRDRSRSRSRDKKRKKRRSRSRS
mmetsp:Transcript_69878/g.183258  ORF Transcript_69878/g.183258 Transcript_69878/m.183258 type:complete len:280 (+) Transcript_69878:427-1266(+)